ncbi:polypyrimidine tract-binding protein homolog 2-like [Macadamia integrifolia]|uniref:polypyrimidine tract-binding protein homolog 2-like n=1 Tax=Macadamia integrifolia TaxID=60698 RepID=UPI001C4F857B|nr:polypyrimidine tract-binding protein homolog 2-like [Macadamia integrifolia]
MASTQMSDQWLLSFDGTESFNQETREIQRQEAYESLQNEDGKKKEKDVGQAILESYSRVLEGLAFNIVTWIEGVLSADNYLLPDHVGPCTFRINFSAHTDLNVKFQSHRSRDYTNPYLPVAPSAIDSSGQFIVGLNGKKQEPESNVLLATIEKMQCAVNVDILYMVFSACGPVQKIAMFEKNAGCQALIQYPDVQTAIVAKEALEGHSIYDGGFCKLHLSYSHHTDLNVKEAGLRTRCKGSNCPHKPGAAGQFPVGLADQVNNDRSRDYTLPGTAIYNTPPSVLGQQPVQMVFPAATQYQFAPATDGIMGARPLAGWAPALASIPQPMPNHLSNNAYMLPAVLPPEMGIGATQFQSGQPSVTTVLHYGN